MLLLSDRSASFQHGIIEGVRIPAPACVVLTPSTMCFSVFLVLLLFYLNALGSVCLDTLHWFRAHGYSAFDPLLVIWEGVNSQQSEHTYLCVLEIHNASLGDYE